MIQRDHDENFKWKATFSLGHASRQQIAARSGPCVLIFPYLSSSTRNSLYRIFSQMTYFRPVFRCFSPPKQKREISQSDFHRIGKTLCRTERASRKCRTTVGKQMLLITWFTSSELVPCRCIVPPSWCCAFVSDSNLPRLWLKTIFGRGIC